MTGRGSGPSGDPSRTKWRQTSIVGKTPWNKTQCADFESFNMRFFMWLFFLLFLLASLSYWLVIRGELET